MTTDEIRIGLHGANGHQIGHYIPKLQHARLTAVSGMADNDKWLADFAGHHPEAAAGATTSPDLQALLDRNDVDLVSICSTRRDDQPKDVIAALNAGKHVIAEKPLATTSEDLDSIKAAAKKSGKQVYAMLPTVYKPTVIAMQQIVRSGRIGEVVQAYALKSYPYRDSRPQDRGIDGGIVQGMIHGISFVRSVTGLDFAEVFAQDTSKGNPHEGQLQMGLNVAARATDGTLISMMANYCNHPGMGFWGNDQLRIFGRSGLVEAVDGMTRKGLCVGEADIAAFDDVEPELPYLQDQIEAMRNPAHTPLMTVEDSYKATEVCLAIIKSYETDQPVKM